MDIAPGGSDRLTSPAGTPRTVDGTSDADEATTRQPLTKPQQIRVGRVAFEQIAVFQTIVVRSSSARYGV